MTTITNTPWGRPDMQTKHGDGITFVSTPTHGGFVLDDAHANQMPDSIAPFTDNRHYWEEDCDANLVIVRFPDRFDADKVEKARKLVALIHSDDLLDEIDALVAGGDNSGRTG